MKRRIELAFHILFWILYVSNTIFTYDSYYLKNYGMVNIAIKQISIYLIYVSFFYSNYFYLIPKYLAAKQYLKFSFGLIILEIITLILFLINSFFLDWYFASGSFFLNDRLSSIPYILFQTIFYLLVSTGARFTRDWFRHQKIREELSKEKLIAELTMLKFQIAPHFLFNTLNNIYSLAIKQSSETPTAILKLSEIMRYVLRSTGVDKVDLGEEVKYLQNFIELQQMRLKDAETVEYTIDGNIEGKSIMPMLFIPFVENAFKHGNLNDPTNKLVIRLSIFVDGLELLVRNGKIDQLKDLTKGIGLANVRRRLELIYGKNYKLHIDNNDRFFEINLRLKLYDTQMSSSG